MANTKLVCNLCGADWVHDFNPGDCPVCKRSSFGIVVKGQDAPIDLIIGAPGSGVHSTKSFLEGIIS